MQQVHQVHQFSFFIKKVESKLGSNDQLLNDAHLYHACVAPAIERTYKNLKIQNDEKTMEYAYKTFLFMWKYKIPICCLNGKLLFVYIIT